MTTTGITLVSIFITIGTYLISLPLSKKYPSVLTMPIFFCTVTIILILLLTRITYEQYSLAKEIMTYLLGPATVALAVPLYRERKTMFKNCLPVIVGVLVGSIATIVSAVYLGIWGGLTEGAILSLSIKSVTIPIASEVATIINGEPSLVVVFVLVTGMFGAMFGSALLNFAKITDPIARGLSYGTISHGIGTSKAMTEGEIEGASSGIAMALAGIITSLVIPLLIVLIM